MNSIKKIALLGSVILMAGNFLYAQDAESEVKEEVKKERPRVVRNAFQSSVLLDHQTIINPKAKTLVVNMQHRFGKLWSGNGFDLVGLYANGANIRLGFEYAIIDQLQIGFGTEKNNLAQDFNIKWSILQQRDGGSPIFLTAFADLAIEAGKDENYAKFGHRVSYYYELMIARKFHDRFTLQVSASYSHFNVADNSPAVVYNEGSSAEYVVNHDMKHDNVAVGAIARIKLSPQSSIILGYEQVVTPAKQDYNLNYPYNLNLGLEVATSAHSFQVFLGNRNGILGQYNMSRNNLDFTKGDFVLGFNITRLWGF
ncbi:MAG: DUF5777 family beta-barrel protein [Flavobacteriales bacterium]|nr:DUF5777 family beta-barrel protein [Flavobacteriales bacterium]